MENFTLVSTMFIKIFGEFTYSIAESGNVHGQRH